MYQQRKKNQTRSVRDVTCSFRLSRKILLGGGFTFFFFNFQPECVKSAFVLIFSRHQFIRDVDLHTKFMDCRALLKFPRFPLKEKQKKRTTPPRFKNQNITVGLNSDHVNSAQTSRCAEAALFSFELLL